MLSKKSQEKLDAFDNICNELLNDEMSHDDATDMLRHLFLNELVKVDKLTGADKPFHGCVECGGSNDRHEAHCSKAV